MLRLLVCTAMAAFSVVVLPPLAAGQETVFSGPQIGEKLPGFKVKGAVGEFADKEFDPVGTADGQPLLLIFFHQKTRPAFGMCRAITKYAESLSDKGLQTHMIILTDDPSTEEKWAKGVIQRSFSSRPEVSVSLDGREGPGAYGLNRNVTLTILVGQSGKVTANFALVQPQLQADGPQVLQAIAEVTGAKDVPTIAELDASYAAGRMANRRRMRNRDGQATGQSDGGATGRSQTDPKLTELLRSLINKQATDEQVEKAAAKVEAYIVDNQNAEQELKRIATTIVESGKLSNYGTEAAQGVLRKWVEEFSKHEAVDDSESKESTNSKVEKSQKESF